MKCLEILEDALDQNWNEIPVTPVNECTRVCNQKLGPDCISLPPAFQEWHWYGLLDIINRLCISDGATNESPVSGTQLRLNKFNTLLILNSDIFLSTTQICPVNAYVYFCLKIFDEGTNLTTVKVTCHKEGNQDQMSRWYFIMKNSKNTVIMQLREKEPLEQKGSLQQFDQKGDKFKMCLPESLVIYCYFYSKGQK